MTLKEKNDVLRHALVNINRVTTRFCLTASAGVSEEEEYDLRKAAFDEVMKIATSVVRLDLFGDEPPKKSWVASEVGRTLRMPVISMPVKAAIKYTANDPGLPRLAASIETHESESGEVSHCCTMYAGNEVLAYMQVYRGKTFAVAMVRRALKGAMSRLGKLRRMTANRKAREAAKKEGK